MMRGNSGDSGEPAHSEPFTAMPFDPNLLNPDLRLERRALLRSLTQMRGRAAAASIDLHWMGGRVDNAQAFLASRETDKLPEHELADELQIIRDMIEDMRTIIEEFLLRRDRRVMGQSGDSSPGAGANQPMGPTTSPTCAVQVASREDRAPPAAPERHRKRGVSVSEEEEDRAPQEAPRGAKRPRKGEEEWQAPPAAARRHFAHYVLLNMVYRVATQNPVADKRVAYEVKYGYWKISDFTVPYLQAHGTAPNPSKYWNGKLPGGLAAFWGKAKEIRQGKRTMEDNSVTEAEVFAWVEKQVLVLSGMTADDRKTWGQPAANAVTLPSTAFASRPPCPPCVLSFCASSISSIFQALP